MADDPFYDDSEALEATDDDEDAQWFPATDGMGYFDDCKSGHFERLIVYYQWIKPYMYYCDNLLVCDENGGGMRTKTFLEYLARMKATGKMPMSPTEYYRTAAAKEQTTPSYATLSQQIF